MLAALQPARPLVRWTATALFAASALGAAAYHTIFPMLIYVAQVAVTAGPGPVADLVRTLTDGYAQGLLVLGVITPLMLGTPVLVATILSGASRYPRWFVVVSPMTPILVVWVGERLTGLPASPYYGNALNLGFLVFFVVSVGVLRRPGRLGTRVGVVDGVPRRGSSDRRARS